MAKIRKVTAATRAAILRKSAYALPNNPSDAGFGADDIRGALFRPLTDERDSALSELDRVAAETGDILALTASETDTVFGQSGNYLHGVSGFIYEEGAAGLTVTGFTGTVPVNPAGTESATAGAAPANPAPANPAPANPAGTEPAPAKNGSPLDPARIPAAGELQVPGRVLFSGRVLPVVGVAEGALSGVGCACLFLPASLTFLGEQALPALSRLILLGETALPALNDGVTVVYPAEKEAFYRENLPAGVTGQPFDTVAGNALHLRQLIGSGTTGERAETLEKVQRLQDIRLSALESSVPAVTLRTEQTSGALFYLPDTPGTALLPSQYGVILSHRRLWGGLLYSEENLPAAAVPSRATPVPVLPTGTAFRVTACGRNFFDADTVLPSIGFTRLADGSFTADYDGTERVIFVNEGGVTERLFYSYQVRHSDYSKSFALRIEYTDDSYEESSGSDSSVYATVKGQSAAGKVVRRVWRISSEPFTAGDSHHCQVKDLCLGFGITEAEPYRAAAVTVDFAAADPADAGALSHAITLGNAVSEVYPGREKGTALLRTGASDLGTLTFEKKQYDSHWLYLCRELEGEIAGSSTAANALCEVYPVRTMTDLRAGQTGIAVLQSGYVVIYDPDFDSENATVADLCAALTGHWFYWQRKSALSLPLGATQALIPLLSGGSVLRVSDFTDGSGVFHAAPELDLTNLSLSSAGKSYGVLRDSAGQVIVPYGQSNMIFDPDTGHYLCDLLSLTDPTDGKKYKITVSGGTLTAVELT